MDANTPKLFCSNCGTSLNADTNFCPRCGTQRQSNVPAQGVVPHQTSQPQQIATQQSHPQSIFKKDIGSGVGCAVLLIVAVIFIAMFMSQVSERQHGAEVNSQNADTEATMAHEQTQKTLDDMDRLLHNK